LQYLGGEASALRATAGDSPARLPTAADQPSSPSVETWLGPIFVLLFRRGEGGGNEGGGPSPLYSSAGSFENGELEMRIFPPTPSQALHEERERERRGKRLNRRRKGRENADSSLDKTTAGRKRKWMRVDGSPPSFVSPHSQPLAANCPRPTSMQNR